MHDTTNLEAEGRPAVFVASTEFIEAAGSQARSLGFEGVDATQFAAALERAGGAYGAPAVIEAVGSDSALACAIAGAGRRATVVAVGAHSSRSMPLATQTAFTRELTLRFAVGDPIRDGAKVMALLRSSRLDPTPVISHRLPLADAVRGYRMFDAREALKVVLIPDAGLR